MKLGSNASKTLMLVFFFSLATTVSASLPVGSIALYSDGKVEKLLSVEGGRMLWEDDRKRQYLRSDNPVVPTIERRDFLGKTRYTQEVSLGDPDQIRKVPHGTPVEFVVVRQRPSGARSTRRWECVYHGNKGKKVLGRNEQVEQYSCERFVVHRKFWHRLVKEEIALSFSRKLGLVVDMKRTRSEKTKRRKLVEIVPPEKAAYRRLSKKVRKLRASK